MSVKIEAPKVLKEKEAFIFWAKQLKKKYPHLVFMFKDTMAVLRNHEYKEFLVFNIFQMESEIEKLEKEDTITTYFTPLTERIFELKKKVFEAKEELVKVKQKHSMGYTVVADYKLYRKVVSLYNKKLSERIVQGEIVNLRSRLGYVRIEKIARNLKKLRVDWRETHKYKQELIDQGKTPKDQDHPDGDNWIVYDTSLWYLRWVWVKNMKACTVPNHTVYGFYPTRGAVGNVKKLIKAVDEDEFLHRVYHTKIRK